MELILLESTHTSSLMETEIGEEVLEGLECIHASHNIDYYLKCNASKMLSILCIIFMTKKYQKVLLFCCLISHI